MDKVSCAVKRCQTEKAEPQLKGLKLKEEQSNEKGKLP